MGRLTTFGPTPLGVGLVLQAVIQVGDKTHEGQLVVGLEPAWFEILNALPRDPREALQISPRQWEEIIAGAWKRVGYEVTLTPHCGDQGRDIIATKKGVGSIRLFDQVKAYAPGQIVTANDVRAMIGVLTGDLNVSKGVVTTTATFAPRIASDPSIAPFVPYRLELRDRARRFRGSALVPWSG